MVGNHKVTCYIPNRDKYKCGVISPIDTTADLQAILQEMQSKNEVRIIKLDRLSKRAANSNMEPSLSVRVTFEERTLPETIKCGYFSYKVRPYIYTPTQCFKCQRLWHTAASCKGKDRCLKCGGQHNTSSCSSTEIKCANCHGSHKANSRECRIIKQGYEIERLRSSGLTFQEAQNRIIQGNTGSFNTNNGEFPTMVHHSHQVEITNPQRTWPRSYRDIVRNREVSHYVNASQNTAAQHSIKRYEEKATQTEVMSIESRKNEKHGEVSNNCLCAKTKFLLKTN